VHETVADVTECIAFEATVPIKKLFLEHLQSIAQLLGRISVVMEMDFHIAESPFRQTGNPIEVRRIVLFGRVEERVLRHTPTAIHNVLHRPRILTDPAFDSFDLLRPSGTGPTRFEMVGDT
jgi:hypothetical protein